MTHMRTNCPSVVTGNGKSKLNKQNLNLVHTSGTYMLYMRMTFIGETLKFTSVFAFFFKPFCIIRSSLIFVYVFNSYILCKSMVFSFFFNQLLFIKHDHVLQPVVDKVWAAFCILASMIIFQSFMFVFEAGFVRIALTMLFFFILLKSLYSASFITLLYKTKKLFHTLMRLSFCTTDNLIIDKIHFFYKYILMILEFFTECFRNFITQIIFGFLKPMFSTKKHQFNNYL